MSVAQVQEALRSALPTHLSGGQPRDNALYFVYGAPLNYPEFILEYPAALSIGVGFIDTWTWHINSLGEANIRPNIIQHKGIVAKGPVIFPMHGTGTFEWMNSGTFGSVHLISPEIQGSLDRVYGGSRVKICLNIQVIVSYPNLLPVIRKLDCIMHYDPRNTMDGLHNIWMSRRLEKTTWLNALASYKKVGVPGWYLAQMSARLKGVRGEAEPSCLDKVERRLLNACQSPASPERRYRVQKHVNMPSRQYGPEYLSQRASSPQSGREQHVRHLPAHHSISRQGRRSPSSSRPIRRQEAMLAGQVGQQPFTWYPQIRSRSAAVPDRFRSTPPALSSSNPDYPPAQNSTVYLTATSGQNTQVPGASSSLPLAQSRMSPVPAIQQQNKGSSVSASRVQLPLKGPEDQQILDRAASSLPLPIMRPVQAALPLKAPKLPDSRPVELSQIAPVALHAPLGSQAVKEEEMGSGPNKKTKTGTHHLPNTKAKRGPAT